MIFLKRIGCLLYFCGMFFAAFSIEKKEEKTHLPDYYEATTRSLFKKDQWAEGKKVLDRGLELYPTISGLNELAGEYFYHEKEYDTARYHLILSVRDNNENVRAKQLLVDVEEETGNYSSAICYVNELLEVNPYWQGLWRRKIDLYRKQGNYVEADRLLKRLNQIYPNDTALQKDIDYRLELNYQNLRKAGNRQEAIKRTNSSELRRLAAGIQIEAARAENQNDPYVLYGKVYAASKNQEALTYLLNTATTRGYNEDALYYLKQATLKGGMQPDLLYKEYLINRRLGNINKAANVLEILYALNPNNSDIAGELAQMRLEQASELMLDELYGEAIAPLVFAARNGVEKDIKEAAWDKLFVCRFSLRQYPLALAALDSMRTLNPDYALYTLRKATVLNQEGNAAQALRLIAAVAGDESNPERAAIYAAAYQEMAIPYIKELLENGATYAAYDESESLLSIDPTSKEGLMFALNAAALLKRESSYRHWLSEARQIYPNELFFKLKEAALFSEEKEYSSALSLLRPALDSLPNNTALIGTFSENSELKVLGQIKRHALDSAMAVVDTALLFDADNRSLLYAKGLVYEGIHQYDSAYYYEKSYIPGAGESFSHYQHLRSLQYRNYKNEIGFEYLQGRYGAEDVITSVATASYTRTEKRNSYTGRLNYAGRDGNADGNSSEDQVPGGIGIQAQVEWVHLFGKHKRWNSTLNAAFATRYFPIITIGAKIERILPKEWTLDLHGGFRRITLYRKSFSWSNEAEGGWVFNQWEKNNHNLLNLGIGSSKTMGDFWVNGKVDLFLFGSKPYVNGMVSGKYFPMQDGVTSITAMAGLGTAPEASVIDNAMPNSFDKLTAMVGLGGIYLLTQNISVGLMGTWYTFYNQINIRTGSKTDFQDKIVTQYKNLYNIHVQLFIHF